MSKHLFEDLKVGMKVRFKTHEQLLSSGWEYDDGCYYHYDSCSIEEEMCKFLGKVCTIYCFDDYGDFHIAEDEDYRQWFWSPLMIDCIIDENGETYHDESGKPFNPYSDYEEDVCISKYNSLGDNAKRIFDDLTIYNKGYNDGFQRALELMREKFNGWL